MLNSNCNQLIAILSFLLFAVPQVFAITATCSVASTTFSASTTLTLDITDTISNGQQIQIAIDNGGASLGSSGTVTTSTSGLSWTVNLQSTSLWKATATLTGSKLNFNFNMPFTNPPSNSGGGDILKIDDLTASTSVYCTLPTFTAAPAPAPAPSPSPAASTTCPNLATATLSQIECLNGDSSSYSLTAPTSLTSGSYKYKWGITFSHSSSWNGCSHSHVYPFMYSQTFSAQSSTETLANNAAVVIWPMELSSNTLKCGASSSAFNVKSGNVTLTSSSAYQSGMMLATDASLACGYTVWYGYCGSTSTYSITISTNLAKFTHLKEAFGLGIFFLISLI